MGGLAPGSHDPCRRRRVIVEARGAADRCCSRNSVSG
jgi:hypothetical protein